MMEYLSIAGVILLTILVVFAIMKKDEEWKVRMVLQHKIHLDGMYSPDATFARRFYQADTPEDALRLYVIQHGWPLSYIDRARKLEDEARNG